MEKRMEAILERRQLQSKAGEDVSITAYVVKAAAKGRMLSAQPSEFAREAVEVDHGIVRRRQCTLTVWAETSAR